MGEMKRKTLGYILIFLGFVLIASASGALPFSIQQSNVTVKAVLNGQEVTGALVVVHTSYSSGHRLVTWGYSPFKTYLQPRAGEGYYISAWTKQVDNEGDTRYYGCSIYATPSYDHHVYELDLELISRPSDDVKAMLDDPEAYFEQERLEDEQERQQNIQQGNEPDMPVNEPEEPYDVVGEVPSAESDGNVAEPVETREPTPLTLFAGVGCLVLGAYLTFSEKKR